MNDFPAPTTQEDHQVSCSADVKFVNAYADVSNEAAITVAAVTSDAQIEVQKKKRQRRATPPPSTSVLQIDGVDIHMITPLESIVSCGVSADGMSGLPESMGQFPDVDQFGGPEISMTRAIPKAVRHRSNYDGDGVETVEGTLSKAATRMRKYRADHRHDTLWLAKEAERMRNMRAARKAGAIGAKEDKPKKEKVGRRKKEKSSSPSELAPVEKFNHEEYLRKEAARVRKYRALKQLDPEWKKNDSDRMRLYRAKRKLDAGSKAIIPIAGEIPEELPLTPLDLVLSSSSIPAHMLLQTMPDEIKAEDTDSEDEAAV